MTALPALTVAFFAFTTGLYMIDTGMHNPGLYYRLRWIAASLPVFVISAVFTWQGVVIPMTEIEFGKYKCMYWAFLTFFIVCTVLWITDIWARRGKHGRK